MKAARFHARDDVRIDDLPEPETREGTVKIRVAGAASAAPTRTSIWKGRSSPLPRRPTR